MDRGEETGEKISTKLKPELRVYQLTACVILPGFKI